jgi:lantibiotic transport system ATP-binding protein
MENTILKINDLSYAYTNKVTALFNISLEINKGDIFFLIGANGSGKSTLIKNVLGLLTPISGDIVVDSLEMNDKNRVYLMRQLGVLIESAAFYDHLTVIQNLKLIAAYYDVNNDTIAETTLLVGLSGFEHKKASILSTGYKQRLGLAMAILHRPLLVILDEPTNGLDPQAIIEFRELITQLNKQLGITFFLTTHILNEVERLATHVAIIRNGYILEHFSIKELFENYVAVQFSFLSDADIKELDSKSELLHYTTGNRTEIIYPCTIQLEDIGLSNSIVEKASLVTPNLETYYLCKCAHYDKINKTGII